MFKYLDAIKGSFIALIIFIIAVKVIPYKGPSGDVEILLTVSTFLFAILAGFFISRLNSRFDRTRDLVASEDAYWLCLYKTAGVYGKNFQIRIRELIDKYYMVAYDFDVWQQDYYYKYNAQYFLAVYDELYKIKKNRAEDPYGQILNCLTEIEQNRNEVAVILLGQLRKGQWAILISLSAIILFSLFYLRIPEFYSQFITVLLATVLVLVLLLIRDLQNLRLGGGLGLDESGQEVFEFMGKPRYYNVKYLANGSMKVPNSVKQYRLGMHKPGEKFKIKLVKNNNYVQNNY